MSEATARANLLLEEAAKEAKADVVTTLRELGLGAHAAHTLFALARVTEATAGDLIIATGIPDSKIYYALRELAEMGLVEVQEGKPRTYRTVTPAETEARLQEALQAKYERERDRVTRLTSLLEPLHVGAESPAMDLAYVVKGWSNVLSRASAMANSARREIILLSSEEEFMRRLEEDLTAAARRGVKVGLAIPDLSLNAELGRRAEVRAIVCTCMVLVVDGQQMLTVNRTPKGVTYAITSTDETLIQLGMDYWESPRCCIG